MTARNPHSVSRTILAIVAGVVAVSVAAQVSVPVPGSPVPQSLQTLAVVLVGAWLGPRNGVLALGLYIVVGAVGAPIFADGAGGPTHLVGPTAGYLAGFVAGAGIMGWWVRQPWGGGASGAFAGGVVVHAVILGLGWARLGALIGPAVAWESGVAPFIWGGVAKSVVAAAGWFGLRRLGLQGLGDDPTTDGHPRRTDWASHETDPGSHETDPGPRQ